MSIKNKFKNRISTCTEECKDSVHMQTEGVQTLILILAGFHIIILLAFLPGDKATINLLFPWGKGWGKLLYNIGIQIPSSFKSCI